MCVAFGVDGLDEFGVEAVFAPGEFCDLEQAVVVRVGAVRQTEYNDLWVIAATSPQTGQAEAILSPVLNTAIINQFLDQFSRSLATDVQAVMLWDGAGFHTAHDLRVPANVTMVARQLNKLVND